MENSCVVWLRRDLRLHDHHALSYATHHYDKVYLLFVFDRHILDELPRVDARLVFINRALFSIEKKLKHEIIKIYGHPESVVPEVAKQLKVEAVCTNRDYEPYAKKRDNNVAKKLKSFGIEFHALKDNVIFEFDEIKNKQGDYYKVYTPFKNAWLAKLKADPLAIAEFKVNKKKIVPTSKIQNQVSSLPEIGFESQTPQDTLYDPEQGGKRLRAFLKQVNQYHKLRDFPAIQGTSKMSPYIRFGILSPRELIRQIWEPEDDGSRLWLSELIWREFYCGVLDANPRVEHEAYLQKYKKIKWENDKNKFQAWCEGRTGVPIIDAAMRELNQTGWMHNRCRMIVASYLVKTLLIDWRWGERYFAIKLMDYDLAANNGGWQWSASTGCDAAPYFRVFNPYMQSKKFDPNGEYIKRFCPELSNIPLKYLHDPSKINKVQQEEFNCKIGIDYPFPIADYSSNRIKVIELYKQTA